ncbi:hypothetical protein H8958_001273 [Nasalis larvatus]
MGSMSPPSAWPCVLDGPETRQDLCQPPNPCVYSHAHVEECLSAGLQCPYPHLLLVHSCFIPASGLGVPSQLPHPIWSSSPAPCGDLFVKSLGTGQPGEVRLHHSPPLPSCVALVNQPPHSPWSFSRVSETELQACPIPMHMWQHTPVSHMCLHFHSHAPLSLPVLPWTCVCWVWSVDISEGDPPPI